MTPRSSSSGFTLLELMIVVAIIGIVTSMAAATATRIGSRNATQNAASDISSLLQNARARAEQRGSDVYVIVYPTMTRAGALTGGTGALFVYEDSNGDFLTGTGPCTGAGILDCSWANFDPSTNNIRTPATSGDRLVQALYLSDYPKQNARFGKSAAAFAAPFTGVGTRANLNGCSFCQTGNKGAVVFTGEQQLRFLTNTGLPDGQRVGGLAIQGVDLPENTFLFGLVGATGLVTLVR
jgi:prepilin-type N-terminal cleavage/methylation domain-containing protein